MLKMIMLLIFLTGNAWGADEPTLKQIYQAAEAGKMNEAQSMMDTVLKAHPNSAKAHFVEAELLARQGQMSRAEAELNNAERLKPGLPFAKPQSVQELKSRIAGTPQQSPQAHSKTSGGGSFPWGLLLIGIGVIAILFYVMRSLRGGSQPGGYQPGGYQPGGYQPMSGAAPVSGGMGSGIVGGLATGAALGAGMVAGEALAHHFIDGSPKNPAAVPSSDSSMGGSDFGITDNSGWGDDAGSSTDSGSDW
jgi:cellobiose-specific phosphotransferase system component IIA